MPHSFAPFANEWGTRRCIMRKGTKIVMPTCEEIKNAANSYNTEDSQKEDSSLRSALEAIQSLPPAFGRFLAEVCLIADWGTFQIYGPVRAIPFLDRVALAERIETSCVFRPMRSWHAESCEAETAMLTSAVDLLSHTELLKPLSHGRPLSFFSKYLHWCVNDGFPIWDTNAQNALNYSRKDTDWEAYKNWLTLVRQEAAKHKDCLKEVRLSGENLVRTLDKALYTIGKPREVAISREELEAEVKAALASASVCWTYDTTKPTVVHFSVDNKTTTQPTLSLPFAKFAPMLSQTKTVNGYIYWELASPVAADSAEQTARVEMP